MYQFRTRGVAPILGAALLAFAVVADVAAQGAALPVTLNGEVRVRTELDGRTAGTANDMVSLLRTRLGVVASPNDRVKVIVRLSDSRAMGEETNTLTDASADRFDLQEGYLQWQSAGGTRLRAGRQEWAYGDQRLIGTVGWANVTRAFDGFQLRLPVSGWDVDGFAATLREFDDLLATGVHPRSNDGNSTDQSLFGLWATDGTYDLFAIAEARVAGASADEIFRRTVGGHGSASFEGFRFDATAAIQFGTQMRSDVEEDISAWMASGSVSRTFAGDMKPRLTLQADVLSGDSEAGDGKDGAFNTLYATNHKFYGFMDLVLEPVGQLQRRGLVDLMVRGAIQPGAWSFGLDLHRFSLAEDGGSDAGNSLGTEVDLTARRTLAEGLGLVMGASIFSPSDAADSPGIGLGDDSLKWGYVQLTAAF